MKDRDQFWFVVGLAVLVLLAGGLIGVGVTLWAVSQ